MTTGRRAAQPDGEASTAQDQRFADAFAGKHVGRKITDWAYDELKSAIVDLRLAPGEILREAKLSQALGVSKTPIREALARLELEGLVETSFYRGAVVTGYSRADLEDVYELRELLEGAAARAAATSGANTAREAFTTLADVTAQAREAGDDARLAELISEFDTLMFDCVTNRRLRAMIDSLRDHIIRIGHLTTRIPGRLHQSVAEHEAIVTAIRDGDADGAHAAMTAHIRSVRDTQLLSWRDADDDQPR